MLRCALCGTGKQLPVSDCQGARMHLHLQSCCSCRCRAVQGRPSRITPAQMAHDTGAACALQFDHVQKGYNPRVPGERLPASYINVSPCKPHISSWSPQELEMPA